MQLSTTVPNTTMAASTPAIFTWSTDAVAVGQRFAYYEDVVSNALTPMCVSGDTSRVFEAGFASSQVGALTIHDMYGTASVAQRGPREISRTAERSFHLLVNLVAPWTIHHRAPLRLALGDAVLVDTAYAYRLDLAARYRVINVKLSEPWLRQWLPHPDMLTGRRIARDSRWGAALTAYLAQLSPQLAVQAPLPSSVIGDHVGALLALMAHELVDVSRSVAAKVDPRLRVVEAIRQRCAEAGLTAAGVAGSLGISLRTLHRSLALGGRTFGRELQTARAERALQILRSPVATRLSVAEVGRRAGFCDPSHFARVLRSHCGLTPVQVRRQTVGRESSIPAEA